MQEVTGILESESRRIRLTWFFIGVGIIVIGVLVTFGLSRPLPIDNVANYGRQLRGHSEAPRFDEGVLPPVGGVHSDQVQNCGVYVAALDSGHAVHSLEHGAVWITYDPALAASEVQRLQQLFRGQSFLLLSPFPGQRSPLALTAWGVQLELEAVDDPRLLQFVDRYRLGPTAPELGRSCQGGVGAPLEMDMRSLKVELLQTLRLAGMSVTRSSTFLGKPVSGKMTKA